MPNITPIQQSFSAGEISPLMLARSDLEGYKNGVAVMENFLPSPHGPAIGRSGSRYIDSFSDTNGHLFPFQISQFESYVVILTDLKLFVADELGVKASANDIQNSNFNLGSANWTDISTGSAIVTFFTGYVELTSSASQVAAITQLVTISGTPANSHRLVFSAFDIGPMNIKIGTTSGGSEILSSPETSDTGQIDFIPGVANVYVTIEVPIGETTRKINNIELRETLTAGVEFTTPWGPDEVESVQVIMPPKDNKMYLVHPNHPPYVLESTSPNTWLFTTITFTSPPVSWAGSNWPGAIALFQGRLWLMATPDDPETIWASVSGSHFDFTTGATAADSQEFTLSNRGRIIWAIEARNFLIGTENGEYIVTSQGGIVWAEDFGIEQQSAYGSSCKQPAKIGNEVLFVTPDRRKVQRMGYEFAADGWISSDLSFPSEHITAGILKCLVFAQHPNNIIALVDQLGIGVFCSYNKTTGIVGWSRQITQGKIISMTVTEEFGQSVIWGLVDRSDGAGDFTLDRLLTPEDIHYMDSYVTVHSTTEVSEITGLDHLEGKVVQVDVDNSVHPDKTVSGGKIDLDYPGYDVAAGLGYTSKIVTFRPDPGAPGGSSYSWNKRYNEIYVSLVNSHVPKINGERPPVRHPDTPMGEAEGPITEHVKVSNTGFSEDGVVTIEQDLPVSCNIAAIYGELGMNKL